MVSIMELGLENFHSAQCMFISDGYVSQSSLGLAVSSAANMVIVDCNFYKQVSINYIKNIIIVLLRCYMKMPCNAC
jgi:hypothetical protein